MNDLTIYSDWAFRFTNVLVSLIQFNLIHSRKGDYCINTSGALWLEGQWLNVIIGFTVLKVAVFSCW